METMTVKQLKEKIADLPDDMHVGIANYYSEINSPSVCVLAIEQNEDEDDPYGGVPSFIDGEPLNQDQSKTVDMLILSYYQIK